MNNCMCTRGVILRVRVARVCSISLSVADAELDAGIVFKERSLLKGLS